MLTNSFETKIFPILGETYKREDFTLINLEIDQENIDALQLDTYDGLANYVTSSLEAADARVGYGGYMEKRNIYAASTLFEQDAKKRDIHLGLDIWVPAETKVYAPIAGKIHSFRYNDNILDYGGTIILEHNLEGKHFYTLYGHLSLGCLKGLSKGQEVAQGQVFAETGDPTENGGWFPHLHMQLILNMMGMEGDFPGVASKQNLKIYQKNCPDPSCLFRMELE